MRFIHQLMIKLRLPLRAGRVKYSSTDEMNIGPGRRMLRLRVRCRANSGRREPGGDMTTNDAKRAHAGGRSKTDAAPDMRERILDAAEDHFSRARLLGRDDSRGRAAGEGRHGAAALLLRHQARPVRRRVRAPRGNRQPRAHRLDRRLREGRRRRDHRRRRHRRVPAADPASARRRAISAGTTTSR